jgi:cytochrome P450
MIEQMLSFMIAGTDTTGGLIQSCISHLATYPQYQKVILKDVEKHA